MRLWQERKKAQAPKLARAERETYDRQIAQAAGAGFFQHRDPVYHVTESFQQTFDAIGRKHAAQAAGEEPTVFPATTEKGQTEGDGGYPDATSTRSFYERKNPEEQGMLRRFSETAFQRGTLSGAVLQGTGSMMLFSCLKKTIGQSQPDKWQQRKLFEGSSPIRNLPSYSSTKMIFNRGFTDSAVGVVVNTLRDARRVVEDMQVMLRGETEMGGKPTSTLRAMYPFLDDSQEQALLKEYREKLRNTPQQDVEGRAALQGAIVRTESLIQKKAQMKIAFTNQLRFLSDRANEALASFTAPAFLTELNEALEQEVPAEPPEKPQGEAPGDESPSDDLPPEEGENLAGEPDPGEDQPTGESAGESAGVEPGSGAEPASEPRQ